MDLHCSSAIFWEPSCEMISTMSHKIVPHFKLKTSLSSCCTIKKPIWTHLMLHFPDWHRSFLSPVSAFVLGNQIMLGANVRHLFHSHNAIAPSCDWRKSYNSKFSKETVVLQRSKQNLVLSNEFIKVELPP